MRSISKSFILIFVTNYGEYAAEGYEVNAFRFLPKGELYYWILYYSYLSPQRYENANEILYALDGKGFTLSIRTYYSRREEALSILSSVLWGYTSVKCNDILDLFMVD